MTTRGMLLCAGFGTRLGELSDQRPKPLLPMVGIPLVRYGAALAVGHGITELVVNLHHRREQLRDALGDGSDLGARVQYSEEDPILGTGGALKAALPMLDPNGDNEPFLSMNGKLVIDADLTGLLAAHRAAEKRAAALGQMLLGTLLVRRVPNAQAWGAVRVDDEGWVRDILGEGQHMFCGIHVTSSAVVERLPDGEACMVRQGYLPWIHDCQGLVAAFEHSGYFAEHSTPQRYLQGNLDLLAGLELGDRLLRHPPRELRSGVDPGADVHPTARIDGPVRIEAGARIGEGAQVGPGVVVAAGAAVAAGANVKRCVVWSGATAEGTLSDAIVSPNGTVIATE